MNIVRYKGETGQSNNTCTHSATVFLVCPDLPILDDFDITLAHTHVPPHHWTKYHRRCAANYIVPSNKHVLRVVECKNCVVAIASRVFPHTVAWVGSWWTVTLVYYIAVLECGQHMRYRRYPSSNLHQLYLLMVCERVDYLTMPNTNTIPKNRKQRNMGVVGHIERKKKEN
jgi:hypothetical protein